MAHRPRKRFGQNFLQNPHIIQNIIDALRPNAGQKVLEIGPGLGALTKPLLHALKQLTAIEIDTDLLAQLNTLPKACEELTLINADALSLDYQQWGPDLRIIGNLPYNISTPLLLHLLHQTAHIKDMHFMLQKEVVERIAATPGCKAYGRLSVMIQYYCEVEHLFNVPPTAFTPEPKVESAVVRITPFTVSPYPTVAFHDLEYLVACAFGMRRKTLANNLKPLFSASQLIALGINPMLRPEDIHVHEYVLLANSVTK
jgi:16S rRNA (adenine1518-N6/adenine1519-N6)-dimethyltransferase